MLTNDLAKKDSFLSLFVIICHLVGLNSQYSYFYYIDYIISYRIISYHIISYHIISYHIISYHIISYHIISYQSYRINPIASCHIIFYYIMLQRPVLLRFQLYSYRPEQLKLILDLSKSMVCKHYLTLSKIIFSIFVLRFA